MVNPTLAETITELKKVAIAGDLGRAPAEKLEEYIAALCHPDTWNMAGDAQFSQICEAVRAHLLRAHISSLQKHVADLHGHITSLNTENGNTQRRVIALTIAALIAGGAQAITAILPYAGIVPTPPTASAPQTLTPKLANPIPAIPLAPGQPIKKAP